VIDLILQIAMRGFDAAILMTHATVVARAFHPVVFEPRCIANLEVFLFLQVVYADRKLSHWGCVRLYCLFTRGQVGIRVESGLLGTRAGSYGTVHDRWSDAGGAGFAR
jgi:hypothetical protein